MFPFSLWILLLVVVCLASTYSGKQVRYLRDGTAIRKREVNVFSNFLIAVILIYFSAKTIANDVFTYRLNFSTGNDNLWDIWHQGLGANPLFNTIQYAFRKYISRDPNVFQLFCAVIIQTLFIIFYRRYSVSLSLTLYFVICSGLYYFSVVSWKQSIAMGIGLVCIPLLGKSKPWRYIAIIALSMLIHPYIFLYSMLPLMISDKVWTKKNIIIIMGMLVAGMSLSSLIGPALDLTENIIGDQYAAAFFDSGSGVKIQRILFFAITPVLSVIFKRRLDAHPFPMMNAFIQMSVISFGFMAMSFFGGANFISRMGTYLEPFTYVSLPYILCCIVPSNQKWMKHLTIAIYFIFFCFLQIKLGSLF